MMGEGKGVAFADTVDAKPRVAFVNGGPTELYAYVTLYNPAFVQEPITIRIRKLTHPKWRYETSFKVPNVLQVVAGVPIRLHSVEGTIGGKPYAPRYIVMDRLCPKRGYFEYSASFDYLYYATSTAGQATTEGNGYVGRMACKKLGALAPPAP